MKKIFWFTFLLLIPAFSQSQSLEYIMDMVHNNPGEKPYETKYNNPEFLKKEGFTSTTPHWYINCLIDYNSFEKNIIAPDTDAKKWIESQAAAVDIKLTAFEKAGIDVYPFTDFIVFPTAIWDKYGKSIKRVDSGVGSTIGGIGETMVPDIQKTKTQELLRAQVNGIFDRFPQLDGLVLRFGETYLFDTPFHKGASPIRKGKDGIQDHIMFINILREEICVKRNKKLFYRTWDFGFNFHNNPEYYLSATNAIEPHPNLIFSVKYQQDDFLRMTPFNPTLGIGKHRQIVESQSRMEAYGKGAHPYYSAHGVINGWPETKFEIKGSRLTENLNNPKNPRGIKDILNANLLCGVNTWSNGGGWQGPYTANELWTDLNTYIIANWAKNPNRSEEELFYEFTNKLNLTAMEATTFRQICLLSIEGVRKGQCNSYTTNNKWWSRDDFFSVADNKNTLKLILKDKLQDKILAEKAEATAIWKQIEALSNQLTLDDIKTQEAIRVSCSYGRIKYELIEQMWLLMIEDEIFSETKKMNTVAVKKALKQYDQLWKEWKNLKQSSSECATIYTDLAFKNKKEGSIGELVEKLRIRIKK